MTRHKTTVDQN